MSFGSPTVCYNAAHTQQLIKENKKEEAMNYVFQYFARSSQGNGLYMWDASEKKVGLLTVNDARNSYFAKHLCYAKPGDSVHWSLRDEFFSRENYYTRDCKPTKPRVYEEKGKNIINTFPGFPHPLEYPDPETWPDEMKRGIKLYWKHWRVVLCNKKEEQFKYCQN